MPSIITRLQSGWNAFLGRDPTKTMKPAEYGVGSSIRPDKRRIFGLNDRSIVSSVVCRIAVDCSQIDIKHVKLENERYVETINSKLNNALTLDANIDQTGRALIQDVVESMCDEGCVAIVPTDTTSNPYTGAYDIEKLRAAKIVEWYPKHVKVELYNENTGLREYLTLPKAMVAIVTNPLYAVMNEPNSTLQRLKRTLANLDIFNERNNSGKLDLIIQLPYVVKSKARQEQAEARRKEIEMQLTGSKYGIAYTDGTERITQLNRPVENYYWSQAKELTSMLYNQLGLTESVFDGTANEETMTNYYNRTIEPILSAITEEMMRKFLTKTARTQGHAIKFFRDPFKLVTVEKLAQISDTLTRNEIASSNEMRTVIGWKPVNDPRADQLRNSNINQGDGPPGMIDPTTGMPMMAPDASYPEGEQPEGEEAEEPTNEDLTNEEIDDLMEQLEEEMEKLQAIKSKRGNSGETEEVNQNE